MDGIVTCLVSHKWFWFKQCCESGFYSSSWSSGIGATSIPSILFTSHRKQIAIGSRLKTQMAVEFANMITSVQIEPEWKCEHSTCQNENVCGWRHWVKTAQCGTEETCTTSLNRGVWFDNSKVKQENCISTLANGTTELQATSKIILNQLSTKCEIVLLVRRE